MVPERLTREDILAIVAGLDDDKVAAILDAGATREDVLEAFAWACGESDVMGDARKSLTGRVAQVHDILTADDPDWEAKP